MQKNGERSAVVVAAAASRVLTAARAHLVDVAHSSLYRSMGHPIDTHALGYAPQSARSSWNWSGHERWIRPWKRISGARPGRTIVGRGVPSRRHRAAPS